MKRIMFLFAFLLIGLSIQSCREMGSDPWDDGNGDPKDTTNTQNMPIEKLIGTKWRLVSIEHNESRTKQAIPANENYTLTFLSQTSVSGEINCNNFGGNLSISNNGYFNVSNLISTEAFCFTDIYSADFRYGLTSSFNYFATEKELRIKYRPDLPVDKNMWSVLVFAPVEKNNGNDDSIAIRITPLEGKVYTLFSFEDAGLKEELKDAQNCKIQFFPKVGGKGVANIHADCNTGFGDLTFSQDYKEIKLSNIVLTKIACPNQNTADRFVEFLRNTAYYEYSDYGNTLTIWSSVNTFAESKMVLKVAQDEPSDMFIDIMQTPQTGVPAGNYYSFKITDLRSDGQNIIFKYSYNGKTADYQIMGYSSFEFSKSDPPQVNIDLVTNGSMNPSSQITQGQATLLLDAIRARILIASPGKTQMLINLRWQGIPIGQLEVTL